MQQKLKERMSKKNNILENKQRQYDYKYAGSQKSDDSLYDLRNV